MVLPAPCATREITLVAWAVAEVDKGTAVATRLAVADTGPMASTEKLSEQFSPLDVSS